MAITVGIGLRHAGLYSIRFSNAVLVVLASSKIKNVYLPHLSGRSSEMGMSFQHLSWVRQTGTCTYQLCLAWGWPAEKTTTGG
jgi:hypothetical protein